MIGPLPHLSFGAVLADPDWLFKLRSKKGIKKSPQAHYDCSPTPEICALMKELLEFTCAPDCALIMWCTWPMLAQGDCHTVMRACGFEPKTGGSWHKKTINGKAAMGGGYIYRSASEPWLLGTRGSPKVRSKSVRNMIDGLRREHSRKPDEMYEMIEKQFDGPYLELFSRSNRTGWTSWGDEVGKFPSSA